MLEPRADAPRADAQRAAAIEAITEFGVTMAQELVAEWRDFWLYLFARFRDGVTLVDGTRVCRADERHVGAPCTFKPLPDIIEAGYTRAWYANSPARHLAFTRT